MEKEREKKSGFARLGRLFHRSKPPEPEPAPEPEPPVPPPGSRGLHRSASDVGPPPLALPEEGLGEGPKRRSFGSWRLKKQQRSSLDSASSGASGGSRSPPPDTASLATGDRSFEISDEDHSIPDMTMFSETEEEPQIFDFSLEIAGVYTNSQVTPEKSRAQPTDTSKKEVAKKPVLGKFGNLFSSNKRRSSKTNPASPTSPNSEKALSPSKDVVSSKSSDKEGLKDKTRIQGSGTVDSKGRIAIGAKGSPVEAPSGSPRKRGTLNQPPKDDPSGKENTTLPLMTKGGENLGLPANDRNSPPLGEATEKERDSKLSFNGLPPAPESVSETSANKLAASLQGSSSGGTGEENGSASEIQIAKLNGSREHLPLKETNTGKESDKTPSKASPTGKKTGVSVAHTFEGPGCNTDSRKAKLLFRLSRPCETENLPSSASDETEVSPNSNSSPSDEHILNPSVQPGEKVLEQPSVALEDAKETKESREKTSESPNPAKVLTLDIYLTKAVEADSNGPAAPSTPKEAAPADTDSLMERRANPNSNRKSSKKRRSFRFNAITTDEQLAEELAGLGEAVAESSPPPEGLRGKGAPVAPENGVKSPPPEPRAAAATSHKVSPKGDSDKSKQQQQQQLPPSSPTKRKGAKEGQPPSPVPASPTARKSQPALKSQQQAPAVLQGGQPPAGASPGSVSTTKGASAAPGGRTTPPASPQGSPTAGDAPRTPSADSSPESRKLQRENSGAKKGPLSTGKRDLERSTERLAAAPSSEAPRHKSNAVILPRSTQTSKLHIPGRPKSVDFSVKTKRSESLESIEETAVDPQIKGNTAKKISLFENKTSNQSHRQIDFYATKSIPLTKKYVGRAKLKFGKQANEAEQVDISTNKQDVAQKSPENGRPGHKGIEELKVKFESAMEGETGAKIESMNGTSPKKKGSTGGPKPVQPQKAAIQVNSEKVNSVAGVVEEDRMMPDTAPSQHKQINDVEKVSETKVKEKCTQPHESATTLLEGETEQDKTALLGQNVDLSKPIASSTVVDSSMHAVADKSSNKSLTEKVFSPKESCVEALENTVSSKGKKNSVKSPSRKVEKPTFKKNDRSKKKQPTGADPSIVQEHLLVQQRKKSAEKLKSMKDVLDAPAISTVNVCKIMESTCGTEPSQQGTSPSVDDTIHNGNNVLAGVEEKVLQENTGISEQTDCGVESSQDGVELSTGSSIHAQAAPTTGIYEFSHNSKETTVDSFLPTVLADTCLDTVESDGNAKGETNESMSVDTSESTQKELWVDAQSFYADLDEAAYVTVTESTKEELSDNGKNVIADLNENTSFPTTESKKVHRSDNAECAITDSSEDTLVSTGESTTTEISDSCGNSMSDFDKSEPVGLGMSTKTELSEKAGHAMSDFIKGAIVLGESTKTELSDEQGNLISDSDQRESLTSEITQSELSEKWEDAVSDLNEIPPFAATTNNELTDIKELVSIPDTRQENTSQDSVMLQQISFELHQVEENISTVNLEKIKTISPDPDASPQDQSQNLSDVPQSEEKIIVLKSQEGEAILQKEDILSQVLPDKRGQIHFSDLAKQARGNGKKENTAAQKAEHQITKDKAHHEGEQPLTNCPKGAPKTEMKCQNGDSVVQSGAPDTHQNIDTHIQNVPTSVQELYALNAHFSSGSIGNGMPFDRNGMFNSRSPSGVFNFSATSDENHLDSSGEMEKFTEIIRQLDSPSTVHQKRKKQRIPRSPQPSFGLPPIHEDYLEKIFDSDMFTFGLGKKERAIDLAPALMLKMQNSDNAARIRPKRASTEQSFLVKSLRASSKDASLTNEEIDGKENNPDVTDPQVKRSRLEKSTLFSSLKSPLMATSKENVFSPSVTSINTITTSFATAQSDTISTSTNSFDTTASLKTHQMSEIVQSNTPGKESYDHLSSDLSTKPNTSLAGLKVPSYMEPYLKTDDEKQAQNLLSVVQLPENGSTDLPKIDSKFPVPSSDPKNVSGLLESIAKMHSSTLPGTDGEFLNKLNPNLVELNPALKVLEMEAGVGNGHEKINPRPGKVVIFGEPNFCGHVLEIFADVPDCSSWELSEVISIKILRGCWLLYEKPNFEGLSIPLEEGEMELTNLWGEQIADEKSTSPTVIGSLRQVVKDYRICQIDLFTESDGLGLVTSYFDDTEEVQVYDRLQKTCSIKVHWGIWLIYEDSSFQGVPFILEPGEYPNLAFWDTHEAYIGSMRPLKMGGRKVEIPNEPKIFVYEKPFFEGMEFELDGEMSSLSEVQTVPSEEQSGKEQTLSITTVASMKVLGGVWVGYEKPGFEGRQYLLEEGDYPLWSDWGGYNEQLQSLRPVLSDFSTSHMIMYSDRAFGEKGSNINVLGIISNMEDTGYGTKTQSINVLSGVWVAYENADFTGEQYVLEKGKYSSFEDWGAKSFKISSVQPIMLDSIGSPMGKFKVLLFAEPEFRGSVQVFEDNISQIPDSFVTKSCKVLAGSWVAFEGEDFGGCQYILEEGTFPNLCSMGCEANTTLNSLHIIDYEFSEPVILLYGKQHYKGKKIEFTSETVSLPCLGYTSRVSSVEVVGGQWAIYEYSNYRGRQILLSPDKIPDWYTISGWHTIGSLRPLIQKRVYFRIRNKSTGMFIGTNGNLDDLKLLRLQVTEDTGAEDQIWAYHEGFLKCRIAEDCCVAVSGSLVISGSKLSLSLEEEKSDSHFWSISPDGRIRSRMKPNLVFDIKGGTQYDQKHVVLNTVCAEKETQCWELLVM